MRRLGELNSGGRASKAYAINNRGQIVGASATAVGERAQANGYRVASRAGLAARPAQLRPVADGGWHAFLWERGKMRDLGTLGGSESAAVAINERGDAVGFAETKAGASHAVLWRAGRRYDLNGALPGGSGWTLEEATDINDRGQIVGIGTRKGKKGTFAFLLTPW